ncbi:MAG: hypothetical protein WA824_06320 [Candidatus Sulfotelmatobacter sp.]
MYRGEERTREAGVNGYGEIPKIERKDGGEKRVEFSEKLSGLVAKAYNVRHSSKRTIAAKI